MEKRYSKEEFFKNLLNLPNLSKVEFQVIYEYLVDKGYMNESKMLICLCEEDNLYKLKIMSDKKSIEIKLSKLIPSSQNPEQLKIFKE